MRIAIFTDSFLPQVNGVVTVTISLAEHLADKGHQIFIIAPQYKGIKEYHHKNITVKRIWSVSAFFYDEFRCTPFISLDLIRFLKRQRVDIIHFQTPFTLGVQAIFLSRILKVPLVGTYHTLISDPEYLRHIKLGSGPTQRLSWAYTRLYYNRCDLVTCPTEIIKKELLWHSFAPPVIAISNGIETGIFDNTGWEKVKGKYNPDGKTLLYTGRIAHEKNIPYLLDCFALVHKKRPTVKLLMVGDGPQMEDTREHIAKLGLNDTVILTGSIPHDKLVKSGIFKACDLFVTASVTETQSITVLEAQANGLPTVCVGERGVADVVKDGYSGIQVKNHNKKAFAAAVIKLLDNDALRERMGANALEGVKAHDMDHITSIWEKQYKALLLKNSKRK